MKLLFVSNLFPDADEPYRGLDNATLLHHLADRWDIRVLAVRPTLAVRDLAKMARRKTLRAQAPVNGAEDQKSLLQRWACRDRDANFQPDYVPSPYVPKVGSRWNHRLMAYALRTPLQRLREQFAFDVVLSSWIFPDSCAVAELAAEGGFPLVAIAQGSDVHQYLGMPARRQIITRLLPRTSAVITRSQELARLLGEAGVPSELLHPIYNGVDLELFCPAEKTAAREELALPMGAPVILFVGNFYAVKNPLVALQALAHLRSERFQAPPVLVMLGGGDMAAEVQRTASRISIAERVILPGRSEAKRVARYMQAADVLLLPSQNEGVPNVILEAFACGLPVVASQVGGIPEVHHGGGFGMLVEEMKPTRFAKALEEVILSPPPAPLLRKHALQFSWPLAADRYHTLLARACR